MKSDLIEILACPACQGAPLEMEVFDYRCEEIVKAELICVHCGANYPVREGIPVMLPDLTDPRRYHIEHLNQGEVIDQMSYEKHNEVRDANIVYYDAVAEVYENEVEQAAHQMDFNQKRIDEIVRDLSEKTQKDLFLDLGCGTGNVLRFGKKYFKRAIGVDISFNMLKVAKQNNMEVIQGDILFLPFKSSLFDMVSIFSVLHHLYEYQQIFTQIYRVLKTGGYLYSDWDPGRKPLPNNKKISWQLYRFIDKVLFPPLRLVKRNIKLISRSRTHKEPIDFLKIRPDLKEINTRAEFHNLRKEEERGLDFEELKRSLIENGFTNVLPTFHWEGKSIDQLSLHLKTKLFFLKFQDYPVERFMENIMTTSQKK
jgi:ubiquinone/menaquinone biosynthesis C-methylase UbiE/uncharacterized protein YbaR (Trm112 family)